MLQSIFFYETGPVVLNSTRKLFMQLCTIVFVENVFALKEELQVAIWYWECHATHMVFLSMSEFIPFIWIAMWLFLLLLIICMRHNNRSVFIPLLDVLWCAFLFNHVYVNDINDKCGNIALIALLNYLSIVIMNEIMSMYVKWSHLYACL